MEKNKYRVPDSVVPFIENGSIDVQEKTVDISAKASPTGQPLSAPIFLLKFKSLQPLLEYYGGDETKVWAAASDAINAANRFEIREELLEENRGPEWEYMKRAREYAADVVAGRKIPKFLRGKSVEEMAKLLYQQATEDED